MSRRTSGSRVCALRWKSLRGTCVGAYTLFQVQGFSIPPSWRASQQGGPRRFSSSPLGMAVEGPRFMIDSHLHVWGDGTAPYPYAAGKEPPERLRESSSAERLIGEMDNAGIGGALIVQPINYKFDHSYVLDTMKKWPERFKGMCLANPSLGPSEACKELERLHAEGMCGVRFNPYLWPEGGAGMKDETGLALYRRAGELSMPVGVMCFKGLGLHLGEIKTLLELSPQTKLIVDHFGFFLQGGEIDETAWSELLELSK